MNFNLRAYVDRLPSISLLVKKRNGELLGIRGVEKLDSLPFWATGAAETTREEAKARVRAIMWKRIFL